MTFDTELKKYKKIDIVSTIYIVLGEGSYCKRVSNRKRKHKDAIDKKSESQKEEKEQIGDYALILEV